MTKCDSPHTIHTIGHSTRTIEAFIELLNAHAIQLLADVRRWPGSKRHPQFNREALNASLKSKGIEYLWRGDLGGFRKPKSDSPNTAWRVSAFRAYADFMLTDEFERIMNEMETHCARKTHRRHVCRSGSLALPPPATRRRLHRAWLERVPYHGRRRSRACVARFCSSRRIPDLLLRSLGKTVIPACF
jgi:hypothetical protein